MKMNVKMVVIFFHCTTLSLPLFLYMNTHFHLFVVQLTTVIDPNVFLFVVVLFRPTNCTRFVERKKYIFATHLILSIICTHISKHSMSFELLGLIESCCLLFLFRYTTNRLFQLRSYFQKAPTFF